MRLWGHFIGYIFCMQLNNWSVHIVPYLFHAYFSILQMDKLPKKKKIHLMSYLLLFRRPVLFFFLFVSVLPAISQRDYTQYYPHILKQEESIVHAIHHFFSQHIQYNFLDEDCEYLLIYYYIYIFFYVSSILNVEFEHRFNLRNCFTVVLDVYRDSQVCMSTVLTS